MTITASEARELYQEPLLTLEDIEEQIRKDAPKWEFSTFRTQRLTGEILTELVKRGFKLIECGGETTVSWKA